MDASESEASPVAGLAADVNRREALAGLADETGGILVQNRNTFGRALERIYQESASYYSIGVTLTALDPKREDWRVELAYAYGNIGLLMEARGDLVGAVGAYRESMAIKQVVGKEKPADAQSQVDLAVSHNKIAMEMAEQLIGVTMQEQGVSRIVAVDMESAVSMAEAA